MEVVDATQQQEVGMDSYSSNSLEPSGTTGAHSSDRKLQNGSKTTRQLLRPLPRTTSFAWASDGSDLGEEEEVEDGGRTEAEADAKAEGAGGCAVMCCAVMCCDVLCCDVLCCDVLCCDVL